MGGGIAGQQRGGLLLGTCLPQELQQAGHVFRVVEGGVGGGPAGQRGGLLLDTRLPQELQQAGHGGRVVEGGVGGSCAELTRRSFGGVVVPPWLVRGDYRHLPIGEMRLRFRLRAGGIPGQAANPEADRP